VSDQFNLREIRIDQAAFGRMGRGRTTILTNIETLDDLHTCSLPAEPLEGRRSGLPLHCLPRLLRVEIWKRFLSWHRNRF
jgi:hypothetical protein